MHSKGTDLLAALSPPPCRRGYRVSLVFWSWSSLPRGRGSLHVPIPGPLGKKTVRRRLFLPAQGEAPAPAPRRSSVQRSGPASASPSPHRNRRAARAFPTAGARGGRGLAAAGGARAVPRLGRGPGLLPEGRRERRRSAGRCVRSRRGCGWENGSEFPWWEIWVGECPVKMPIVFIYLTRHSEVTRFVWYVISFAYWSCGDASSDRKILQAVDVHPGC